MVLSRVEIDHVETEPSAASVACSGEPRLTGGDNVECDYILQSIDCLCRLITRFPAGACDRELTAFENSEATFREQRFEHTRKLDVALHGGPDGSPSVCAQSHPHRQAGRPSGCRHSPLPGIELAVGRNVRSRSGRERLLCDVAVRGQQERGRDWNEEPFVW